MGVTGGRESVDYRRDGRSLQADLVRRGCGVPVAGGVATGNPGLATPAQCAAASIAKASEPQQRRPAGVHGALSPGSQRAGRAKNPPARNRHPLAPRGVQVLLALEITAPRWPTKNTCGHSHLIREMSVTNPLWGVPRIHGELLKLGIDVGQTTVAKYMAKRRRPPSQGWKTFLRNHADAIASMDTFVVPTISFRLLYGLVILHHSRRELLWLGVTSHPDAEWIARQLTEACGWSKAPQYLVRDRDAAYGTAFIRRVGAMGIRDRPISARSPWQNGYAERLIGSIRRECLDHVVVFGEGHLRHLLKVRTHLSLQKDAPLSREVRKSGHMLSLPLLGGLHHQYVRV
jgi:transposase InsO family protein